MDFTSINKIGKMAEFLPTKKLAELSLQADYPITDIKAVQTKFGKRIVADVSDEFVVFLPARFVKAFDEDKDMFEKMVEAAHNNQLCMNYIGGKYNSIEFKRI